MRTIRFSVFETNSSSCHVCTIAGANKLKQFEKGEVYCVFNSFGFGQDGTVVIPDSAFKTSEETDKLLRQKMFERFFSVEELTNYVFEEYTYLQNYKEEIEKDCKFIYENFGVEVVDDVYTNKNTDEHQHLYSYFSEIIEEIFDDDIRVYNIKYNNLEDTPFANLDYFCEQGAIIEGPVSVNIAEYYC